mmetsp:Transcript_31131/g.59170  ORF Transcript_31131/g.59170 Transcript_31131/m.59170 type:complete len:262 (-) Transcript_31131:170-955(-)
MRLSSPCLLLLASIGEETTTAFTPPSLINTRSRRHVVVPNTHHQRQQHLSMALSDLPGDIAAPPKKKVLTAADVMAKSKTSASGGTPNSNDPSAPGEQESPKLFSPAIYDDFQSALLALEKRIEGGPGSLSSEEVRKFEEETGRIAREMREYASDPKGTGEAIRKGYEMSAPAVDVVAKEEEEEEAAAEVVAYSFAMPRRFPWVVEGGECQARRCRSWWVVMVRSEGRRHRYCRDFDAVDADRRLRWRWSQRSGSEEEAST